MPVLDSNPGSLNLQSSLNWTMNLIRAPGITYFLQSIKVPNIMINPPKVPSPSLGIPMVGDHLNFEPLEVKFKVADNFQDWLEIYNWLVALADPSNKGTKYLQLENNPSYLGYGLYSDLQVITLDSQKNPSYVFTFERCFPMALSGPEFNTTDDNLLYITASVQFKYLKYEITLP